MRSFDGFEARAELVVELVDIGGLRVGEAEECDDFGGEGVVANGGKVEEGEGFFWDFDEVDFFVPSRGLVRGREGGRAISARESHGSFSGDSLDRLFRPDVVGACVVLDRVAPSFQLGCEGDGAKWVFSWEVRSAVAAFATAFAGGIPVSRNANTIDGQTAVELDEADGVRGLFGLGRPVGGDGFVFVKRAAEDGRLSPELGGEAWTYGLGDLLLYLILEFLEWFGVVPELEAGLIHHFEGIWSLVSAKIGRLWHLNEMISLDATQLVVCVG